jgi:hypothetical protein
VINMNRRKSTDKYIREIEETKRVKERYVRYTIISCIIVALGYTLDPLKEKFNAFHQQRIEIRQESVDTVSYSDRGNYTYVDALEEGLKKMAETNFTFDPNVEIPKLKIQIGSEFEAKEHKAKWRELLEYLNNTKISKILNPISPFLHALWDHQTEEQIKIQKETFQKNQLPQVFIDSIQIEYAKLVEIEKEIDLIEKRNNLTDEEKQSFIKQLEIQMKKLHEAGKNQRVKDIVSLIVKEGYEPDDLEGFAFWVADTFFEGAEFIKESTWNLLKDEFFLETMIFIYAAFLIDAATSEKTIFKHLLFALLIDKAKLTSFLMKNINRGVIMAQNRSLDFVARVEALKFAPEEVRGIIIRTLLSNHSWEEKQEIIRAYFHKIQNNGPLNPDEQIAARQGLIQGEVSYLWKNMFPTSEKVKFQNKNETTGIFKEIRSIRDWILYYKFTIQLPLLIHMSGNLRYAIWDFMIAPASATDGFFFKEGEEPGVSKMLKILSKASERLGNKVANKGNDRIITNHLRRMKIDYLNLKTQKIPFNVEVSKSESKEAVAESSGDFDDFKGSPELAQDMESQAHLFELFGTEFMLKAYTLYTTVQKTIDLGSQKSEEMTFTTSQEEVLFDYLKPPRNELTVERKLVSNKEIPFILQKLQDSIDSSLQDIKEKILPFKNKEYSVKEINHLNSLFEEAKNAQYYHKTRNLNNLSQLAHELESFVAPNTKTLQYFLTQHELDDLAQFEKSNEIRIGVLNNFWNLDQQVEEEIDPEEEKNRKYYSFLCWVLSKNISLGYDESILYVVVSKREVEVEGVRFYLEIRRNIFEDEGYTLTTALRDRKIRNLYIDYVDLEILNGYYKLPESDGIHHFRLLPFYDQYACKGNSEIISIVAFEELEQLLSDPEKDAECEAFATASLALLQNFVEETRSEMPIFFTNEHGQNPTSYEQRIYQAMEYMQHYSEDFIRTEFPEVPYFKAAHRRLHKMKRYFSSAVSTMKYIPQNLEFRSLEAFCLRSMRRCEGEVSIPTQLKFKHTIIKHYNKENGSIHTFADMLPKLIDTRYFSLLKKFDRSKIVPHLFSTATIFDVNQFSRQAGVVKIDGQWNSHTKFISKKISDTHFKHLLDPGFNNFLVHIAFQQEIDLWKNICKPEDMTLFESLILFVDSPEFFALYNTINKEDIVKNQINGYIKDLLKFHPDTISEYHDYQPEPRR